MGEKYTISMVYFPVLFLRFFCFFVFLSSPCLLRASRTGHNSLMDEQLQRLEIFFNGLEEGIERGEGEPVSSEHASVLRRYSLRQILFVRSSFFSSLSLSPSLPLSVSISFYPYLPPSLSHFFSSRTKQSKFYTKKPPIFLKKTQSNSSNPFFLMPFPPLLSFSLPPPPPSSPTSQHLHNLLCSFCVQCSSSEIVFFLVSELEQFLVGYKEGVKGERRERVGSCFDLGSVFCCFWSWLWLLVSSAKPAEQVFFFFFFFFF